MADSWKRVEVDLSAVEAQIDSLQSALEKLAEFLKLLSSALNALSTFFLSDINLIKALIDAAVDAIENFVVDLLQNNVAIAVHVNLNWRPEWTYEPDPEIYNNVSFKGDNELPWMGQGLSGWLLDIGMSAQDPSNEFRPLTDADTKVGGIIIVKGIASADELSDLMDLYDLFSDFSDFKEALDMSQIENADENMKSLLAMGSAALHEFVQATGGIPEAAKEGLEDLISGVANFSFKRGDSPIWFAIPLASLLPPLKDLMEILRKIADNLRMSVDAANVLAKLADLLAQRAELLADAAEQLASLLDTLESLIEFLTSVDLIVLTPQEGGFGNFINRAAFATDAPNFGPNGIVAGVVAATTSDDPFNNLESLFQTIGIQFSALAEDTTTKAQNISDTYDELF